MAERGPWTENKTKSASNSRREKGAGQGIQKGEGHCCDHRKQYSPWYFVRGALALVRNKQSHHFKNDDKDQLIAKMNIDTIQVSDSRGVITTEDINPSCADERFRWKSI